MSFAHTSITSRDAGITRITVQGTTVTCLNEVRVLVVSQRAVRLSQIEYSLVMALIDHGCPCHDRELAQILNMSKDDPWAKEAIAKHIDNIRRKLRKNGLALYIHRVAKYGYVVLAQDHMGNKLESP